MRPHPLQSPHAYTVRTSQNDIVDVALLKFILNKGPNRLWYKWWHGNSDSVISDLGVELLEG